MDYLYYSNYCKHSAKLLQHLAKTGAVNKLNCVCVDRRKRNPQTGQIVIITETGTQHPLPISVTSVPTLLLVSDKYRVVVGKDIYDVFPETGDNNKSNGSGEPEGFLFSGPASMGESYSNFGAGGAGVLMDLPADNYRSNKLTSEDMSMSSLQEKRNADLANLKIPFMVDVGNMPGNAAVIPMPEMQQQQTYNANPYL